MYWVSGWATIGVPAISSTLSSLRRQAMGFLAPLREALLATRARVSALMPWSCM